ncbi:MAG: hypothetical protein ACOC3U_09630, partial [Thiohalospira sp.]
MILLLALSTSVVGAGPEWRQRNDGLQAAERTLAHARRLAPEQPTRALALLRQGLAAHPRHIAQPTREDPPRPLGREPRQNLNT